MDAVAILLASPGLGCAAFRRVREPRCFSVDTDWEIPVSILHFHCDFERPLLSEFKLLRPPQFGNTAPYTVPRLSSSWYLHPQKDPELGVRTNFFFFLALPFRIALSGLTRTEVARFFKNTNATPRTQKDPETFQTLA